jgi:hypothetical protein
VLHCASCEFQLRKSVATPHRWTGLMTVLSCGLAYLPGVRETAYTWRKWRELINGRKSRKRIRWIIVLILDEGVDRLVFCVCCWSGIVGQIMTLLSYRWESVSVHSAHAMFLCSSCCIQLKHYSWCDRKGRRAALHTGVHRMWKEIFTTCRFLE